MPRQFHIAHASIDIVGMGAREVTGTDDFFRDALATAWEPGTEVTRHNRTWKLTAPRETTPDLWAGHIGFIRAGGQPTLRWNNETQDFVRGEVPSGVVVPFVISIPKGIVSFQLVAGEVRINTVTTNLQALLNQNAPFPFSIAPLARPTTFEAWRRGISLVTKLNVRLDRPNPRYNGEKVEDLIEGLDAYRVRLRATAGEEGIDTSSSWFEQSMDHVRRGNGTARVTGIEAVTEEPSTYSETDQGGGVSLVETIDVEEDAVEASPDDLASAMSRLPDTLVPEVPDDDETDDSEEA